MFAPHPETWLFVSLLTTKSWGSHRTMQLFVGRLHSRVLGRWLSAEVARCDGICTRLQSVCACSLSASVAPITGHLPGPPCMSTRASLRMHTVAQTCTVAMHVPGKDERWSRFLTPHPTALSPKKIPLPTCTCRLWCPAGGVSQLSLHQGGQTRACHSTGRPKGNQHKSCIHSLQVRARSK